MFFSNIHSLFCDALTRSGVQEQDVFKDHEHPPHCRVVGRFLLLVPDMLIIIFEGATDSHLSK